MAVFCVLGGLQLLGGCLELSDQATVEQDRVGLGQLVSADTGQGLPRVLVPLGGDEQRALSLVISSVLAFRTCSMAWVLTAARASIAPVRSAISRGVSLTGRSR